MVNARLANIEPQGPTLLLLCCDGVLSEELTDCSSSGLQPACIHCHVSVESIWSWAAGVTVGLVSLLGE